MAEQQDINIAVLTADLVDSTMMEAGGLEEMMKEVAQDIERHYFKKKKTFEFFRGDSFQAIIPIEMALPVALQWRAGVLGWLPSLDIRIAIGIGTVAHRADKLSLSNGSAFVNSGQLLDQLKETDDYRIAFSTGQPVLDNLLLTNAILAEQLINRWKAAGAEAVYYQLMYDETQSQLAERLGISQPSVHKRLESAGWKAISFWNKQYTSTIADLVAAQLQVTQNPK